MIDFIVCRELGLKSFQARQILSDMVDNSLIETDGENKNRRNRANNHQIEG